MRFMALHNETSRLPLVKPENTWKAIGTSTTGAILAGVQNVIIFEMERTIEMVSDELKNIVVLLTGGDATFFDPKLKKTIFVVPNLISVGLNCILNYNAENI
jgi:type III pantothenate kinase